ncbi:MAG: GPW/gp25 family protein [Chitinophagaceae bacterium]
METNKSFLGTGWAFPPSFDVASGTVEMVSNELDIAQSLDILLSTSLGERVMQPKYGCNLVEYMFLPLNSSVVGYIKDLVEHAILFYEPRIIADKIDVTPQGSIDNLEGRFVIEVTYTIPESNSRFNYVYDYYKNQSMSIS